LENWRVGEKTFGEKKSRVVGDRKSWRGGKRRSWKEQMETRIVK